MNVSTDLIASSAEDTFSLTALEGINFVIIEGPEFAVTGEETTFTILPHTGNYLTVSYNETCSVVSDDLVVKLCYFSTRALGFDS